MASRRVACAPTRRGVRGPLVIGDLGTEGTESVVGSVGCAFASRDAINSCKGETML